MRRWLWLVTLAAMTLLPAAAPRCEEGRLPTVAVLPFQVFNAPDVAPSAPGLQAALASRLSGPGYRVLTPGPGEGGEADWTVRTSLTRLGSRMTLDAALEPRAPGREGRQAFQTVESVEGLLDALDAVAAALKVVLAPVVPAAPVASATPAAPVGPVASAPAAAPEARPAPATALASPAPGGGADLTQAFLGYRTGALVPGEVRGLAVVDADRDGATEVVALLDDRLSAFRDDGTELKPAWEVPLTGLSVAAVLSAGDIDGDGTRELFVAGLDSGRIPVTRVYQWAGASLAERVPALNAFARVVTHPVGGDLLLGMVPGIGKDLFGPKQYAFTWDGKGYVRGDALDVPAGVSMVNADWLAQPTGQPLLVTTGGADKFRVYDAQGKKLYQSDDQLKGGSTVLYGEERYRDYGDADLLRVQPRSLTWTAPGGPTLLLLHKNHGTIARIFQRSADFTHGQWLAFRWDGLTLLPVAEGPKLPGYFNALELGPSSSRPGRQTLYTALVQSDGIVFEKRTTRLLAVEL